MRQAGRQARTRKRDRKIKEREELMKLHDKALGLSPMVVWLVSLLSRNSTATV
jgi:hypothetical protein